MVGGGWVVGGGWWVLDFTRLMLISTQVEVVVEVGVELGNLKLQSILKINDHKSISIILLISLQQKLKSSLNLSLEFIH